jgi:hypothetical protein
MNLELIKVYLFTLILIKEKVLIPNLLNARNEPTESGKQQGRN